ncbi:MAG: acyl-CoA dehydrogenase family protein [Deltaproteobacteria bacterium]|nr:acyl-CoA dehydrogenase family protein [Deltaproteobacteria bacterium]MBW2419484.1 acyl-CoA dehydrogenase family protein [Deltaproteobacteria bacterium]
MDFNLTPEQEAFRDEVRGFLDENLPPEDERDAMFPLRWSKLVREKRWVGFSWPEEVGGGGGNIMEQAILKEELASRRAPPLGSCIMGLAWVGPALIQYGTEEQKQRFIPDILDSKYQWCTGYSEPDIGSDLAALQCRGERRGDKYIVKGQKIWTSLAQWAKWMILLVRTDNDGRTKHEGITCLLVEMDSPGVTVAPIANMARQPFYAEVFFDEVEVPVENLLGEEGQGWQITIGALANERSGISEVSGLLWELDRLKELARASTRDGKPALEDARVRRRIAEYETRIAAMRFNGLRYLTKQIKGERVGSETSVNKLHTAYMEKYMAELAIELQGSYGCLAPGTSHAVQGGRWQKEAFTWATAVIGGGTPNIQRNIIAERILGLPRD